MILDAKNKNRVSITVIGGMVCLGTDSGGTARKSINCPAFDPDEARKIAKFLVQAATHADGEGKAR